MTVHVTATGARTALGLHAAATAAACRAGVSAVRQHPFMIDRVGDRIPCAIDRALDATKMGVDRYVTLTETALREASEPLQPFSELRLRVPLYLALPEFRPGFTGRDADELTAKIARIENLPFEIADVRTSSEGHAAGLSVLSFAASAIQRDEIDLCIVGGVDSYLHPDTLEWLDANRQLAGEDARSAFVPGEAAGFCILASDRMAKRLGMASRAEVSAAAVGREARLIKSADVCLGEGLTDVVRRVTQRVVESAGHVDTIICDINGERYRGEEWGFVCLRVGEYFADPTAYWSPADCWGDVGAASGPLFVMLACEMAHRGVPATTMLLWASSEGGLRAAALLRAPSA
jgi:3-oxoacyl-[acyl-carrier-protein] synthase-1